ncbi:MAG: transglycosylase SLT domain-containing protein [Proteobacteria bacterium]|nr:transglycosylase SLT domain-containing protein [Pseudomonadota bacterium]
MRFNQVLGVQGKRFKQTIHVMPCGPALLALLCLLFLVPLTGAAQEETTSTPSVTQSVSPPAPATPATPTATPPPETGILSRPAFYDWPLPDRLVLCGEPMPLDNRHVYEMLDREFTITVWNPAQVFLWLKRKNRYFPHIENRLAAWKMPDDLKYLAVAESNLIPEIRSRAGATGVWQFMHQTGLRFGLEKNQDVDERRSFIYSTEAALKYLKHLRGLFGGWTLAMAAYNCGEGRILGAMKDQEARDYYRLELPDETERYIYRIAAIKLILENPTKFGYHLPDEKAYPPIEVDVVQVNLKENIHVARAAQAIGTDFKELKLLNPQIIGSDLPRGQYELFVPKGSGKLMSDFLNRGGSPTSQIHLTSDRYYTVKRGDTLSGIAAKTGVPMDTIRRLNNMRGATVLIGQRLRLSP